MNIYNSMTKLYSVRIAREKSQFWGNRYTVISDKDMIILWQKFKVTTYLHNYFSSESDNIHSKVDSSWAASLAVTVYGFVDRQICAAVSGEEADLD